MTRPSVAVLVLASVLASPIGAQDRVSLGSLLRPGMQLVYTSDGSETPWTIDSIVAVTARAPGMTCVRIWLRLNPAQPTAQARHQCADSSRMYTWDGQTWPPRATRPLREDTQLETRQADGTLVRYEAAAPMVVQIPVRGPGGTAPMEVTVIPTVVTTFDPAGKPVRRLRELFSLGLATATRGTFEEPDAGQASGWRAVRHFGLAAIRRPD